jgi:hypothetical protein
MVLEPPGVLLPVCVDVEDNGELTMDTLFAAFLEKWPPNFGGASTLED